MKAFPIVIAAFVLAVIIRLLRVRKKRRSASQSSVQSPSPAASRATRLWDRRLFGDTGIVAGREIRERLRGRVFRVVTVILFGVVAAAVIIPTLHGRAAQNAKVGVVADSTALNRALEQLASSAGLTVRIVSEPDLAQARTGLDSGRLDLVLEGTKKVLLQKPLSITDTSPKARYVREVSLDLGAYHAYARAGLTSGQAAIVAGAQPLPVESLQPGKPRKTTSESTALLGIILIFVVLNQYLTWTLMGVMEEKASRVVEVLLATVRPIQLLAGKVAGIGAVALAQAVALVAFALVLGKAVGSNLVHGTAPVVVAAALVWLVLGYGFYSWVYAAAGSLGERQDQIQSLALPLSLPLLFGYIVSLIGVSSGSPSMLVKVLAYLPPTAPFAMPTLVGFNQATWWQFLLSVALCILCTVAVAAVAARIYRSAVLRTGGRVRLRQLMGPPAR